MSNTEHKSSFDIMQNNTLSEDKSLKCSKCNKIFSSKFNLKRHEDKKSYCTKNKDEDKRFECFVCKKRFTNKNGLKYHENKKTPCVTNNIIKDIDSSLINTLTCGNNNTVSVNVNIDLESILKVLENSSMRDKFIDLLVLSSVNNSNKFNILDVIEEINEILKIMYTDSKNKHGNVILAFDIQDINKLYVNKNNKIDELDDPTLIDIISKSFQSILTLYPSLIDSELKQYYRKFINTFSDVENIDLSDIKYRKFILAIRANLRDDLIQLYQALTDKSVKNQKRVEENEKKFITRLKTKKEEHDKSKLENKPNYINSGKDLETLNHILNRLRSNGDVKLYNTDPVLKNTYFILALIELYFKRKYLTKPPTFKSNKMKFQLYDNKQKKWLDIDRSQFVDDLFKFIINELKKNNIGYNVMDEDSLFFYNKKFDYELLYEDINYLSNTYDNMIDHICNFDHQF